jgi:hypothetical protein
MDLRDERKRTFDEASKQNFGWHQNQGVVTVLGAAWQETYFLAMWCPVLRRRDSNSGFRMELENLVGDGKGKGTSGRPARPESTEASTRGGLPRSTDEAE